MFDAALVTLDATQLILSVIIGYTGEEFESVSVFRLIRLLKLTRLVRLFRLLGCQDLLTMIGSLINGMDALWWAVILLILFIYVIASNLCGGPRNVQYRPAIHVHPLPV